MAADLTIDESHFTRIVNIESQYNSLTISNTLEIEVNAEALIEHLNQMEGTDRIEKLIINYNSSLGDLSVLQAFSSLKILYVYGHKIKSFDGIERLCKGEYIQIQTHRNRRRDISQLSQTKLKRMDIYVEQIEDYSAAARCKHLQTIDIFHSSIEPDFTEWKESPVEKMAFKSCKFKELGNVALISGLTNLSVRGCRSLERFKGDNSSIKRLEVDSCKKLDLSTLKTFKGVEVLIVNSCTKEFKLKEIEGLKEVKILDFILCNVEVDLINLKDYFPNLESMHISSMKKDYGLQLKHLNPDVQITSRSFEL
ncbi:hypothetical protein AB4Z17_28635 [Paenibacillus sp. TAF43_2]|uniref:hypothetical protein n=1 Tax=Paenibacillus sp. TAF43_2 TaxID=3233069 RepID=UPI003F96189C